MTDACRVAAAEAVALWETCGLTRPWNDPHDDFARAAGGPSSAVLGLRDGDELVGTVMVGHDGHRGWVYYLAVRPSHQRRGLGRELMQLAEKWLQEREIPKLQLMVRTGNEQVLGFYRTLGYEDSHVTVMGKRLDS